MDNREVRADELVEGDSLPKFYKCKYKSSRGGMSYYNIRTNVYWKNRDKHNHGEGEHCLIGKFYHKEQWDLLQQEYIDSGEKHSLKPIVHHKDDNKNNNVPNNLNIMTWGETHN